MNKLKVKKLRQLYFPLPPLEEQKEIVRQVETLINNISTLEIEIIENKKYAEMLMQSVLQKAFEG